MYSCLHQRDSLKDSVRWPETPGCLIPVSQSIVGVGARNVSICGDAEVKQVLKPQAVISAITTVWGLIKNAVSHSSQVLQNIMEKCWKETLWYSWVKRKECVCLSPAVIPVFKTFSWDVWLFQRQMRLYTAFLGWIPELSECKVSLWIS